MIENIPIQKMELKDLQHVLEIESHSFTTPWSHYAFLTELRDNSFASYFVAKIKSPDKKDEIVGYAGMWIIMDEAHITTIAVEERYRRMGVGEKLLRHIIETAKEKGAVGMTLEVKESNMAARNLYEKLGFEIRGIRKKYYIEDNEDALIMWKDDLINDVEK